MRTLRVVGLHEDGKSVVCEDPTHGEQFLLPADERLRAAARGDVTRLGQIEVELESQMRPREIQARIRAGDSVEQIASSANVPMERVERYAHPVLQERSRKAQLAQQAHPVHEDGPDVRTLGEVVSYAFGVRAQDYNQAVWDAWRADDGRWIISLHWRAGHTDNTAHWSFATGAHGGTVTPIDEHAEDLLQPHVTPRGPRAVTTELDSRQRAGSPAQDEVPEREVPHAREPEREADTAELPSGTEHDAVPADTSGSERGTTGRKNHPVVPAWEDVLLGVRSQRG